MPEYSKKTKEKLSELKAKYGKNPFNANGSVTPDFLFFVVEHYEFRMGVMMKEVSKGLKIVKDMNLPEPPKEA
jgi:hypothetical protein